MLKKFSAALFLALTLTSAACAADTLSVTYIKPPLNVPSMVEKELGLFEKHCGMPVEYLTLFNGPQQVQALMAGNVQFLPAAGSTSIFLAAAQGADLKILSIFARSPQSFKILAAKDSPLSRPSDLKDKRVAGPKGTILHELLALWLAEDGLTVSDVDFVSMDIPAAAAALASGKADAALLTGVPAWKMAASGWKVLCDGTGHTNGEVLTVTTGKMLREHPELVRNFMLARAESVEWIKEHQSEAIALAARELGISEEDAARQLPLYDFRLKIFDDDAKGLQRTVDFMREQGMLSGELDVRTLFTEPLWLIR